jgi:hypothetical protein
MARPTQYLFVAVAATDQVLAFNSSTGAWVVHAATGLTNADKVDA